MLASVLLLVVPLTSARPNIRQHVQLVEESGPSIAVCLAGAARSFASVPVVRGLKKNVLSPLNGYNARLFAALTLEMTPLDGSGSSTSHYNTSLAAVLTMQSSVDRALEKLKPELAASAMYSASDALTRFPTCSNVASDPRAYGTQVPMLYGLSLCHALIRQDELKRGTKFEFVIRLRPDHLVTVPLPTALNLSTPNWPSDRIIAPPPTKAGGSVPAASDFAVLPARLAPIYLNTFYSAGTCLYREKGTVHLFFSAFPHRLQCAERAAADHALSDCVIAAAWHHHSVPPALSAPHPARIARICNRDHPSNETCVTDADTLKHSLLAAEAAAAESSFLGKIFDLVVALA